MITVLLNPRAGQGARADVESQIQHLFLEAGTDARVTVLGSGIDPIQAARKAVRGETPVVAAGGDGTVSAIASALVGTQIPLGVLPLGTLNHFARDLRLPMSLETAVKTIAAGHTVAVDVGRINGRVFLNNASIGVYPNIVELREQLRRQGRRKWSAFLTATGKVLWTFRGVNVSVVSVGERWSGPTPFVFVGNNEYTVQGPKLGARGTLTRGRVVAYVASRLRARHLPILLARALAGRALKSGSFEILAAPQLDISMAAGSLVRVALDGEVTTLPTPLHIESDPGALRVFAPAD